MEIKIKEIKPLFTTVITTMDIYEKPQYIKGTKLIDASKSIKSVKELQTVIAVGPHVSDIKVGDLVCIDPKRFGKVLHREGSLEECTIKDNPIVTYNFDIVEINNSPCLFLQDRDIKYIVSDYEDVPKEFIINKPEIVV